MASGEGDRSVGQYLHSLRAGVGVSVADLARATRINEQYLVAMESDELAQLPAPVFIKGFIRAYCRALGRPADVALALYQQQSGRPAAVPAPARGVRPTASWIGHPLTVSVALLIVFGAGVLALNFMARGPSRQAPAAPVRVYQGRALDGPPGRGVVGESLGGARVVRHGSPPERASAAP